jgi:hypothetical protein
MKQFSRTTALAAFICGTLIGPAFAAPPTVVPSPGYDARLQEQRAASHAGQSPTPVYSVPRARRHKPHRGAMR